MHKNQSSQDLIGRPQIHASAFKQVTGEAIYLDDMPQIKNELYLAFVLSNRAHAKILNVDPSKALAMKGVVAFYSAKDISEHCNSIGSIVHDEELFISETVQSKLKIFKTVPNFLFISAYICR